MPGKKQSARTKKIDKKRETFNPIPPSMIIPILCFFVCIILCIYAIYLTLTFFGSQSSFYLIVFATLLLVIPYVFIARLVLRGKKLGRTLGIILSSLVLAWFVICFIIFHRYFNIMFFQYIQSEYGLFLFVVINLVIDYYLLFNKKVKEALKKPL
jgi:hypothetical protein